MVQRHIFSVREDPSSSEIFGWAIYLGSLFLGSKRKTGPDGTCRRVKLGPEAYLFNA